MICNEKHNLKYIDNKVNTKNKAINHLKKDYNNKENVNNTNFNFNVKSNILNNRNINNNVIIKENNFSNLSVNKSNNFKQVDIKLNKTNIGKISIIIGPMFSGKSTELIRNIKRYSIKKKSTIVVAYEFDNRYSNDKKVVTHDKYEYPAIKSSILTDILDTIINYEVIGIDEGQFYPDLVQVCEYLANIGKIIIISALSGNYKREPFDVISKILPKCESITNISAICFNCNEDAHYTIRISEEKDEVVIGGEDKYKPSCRNCYFNFDLLSNNCFESSKKEFNINKTISSVSTLYDSDNTNKKELFHLENIIK